MSLDLAIPGDHAGVRDSAEWLSPAVSQPVLDGDIALSDVAAQSNGYWTGASGNAFRGALQQVRNDSSGVPSFLQDVAEVLRAYANRLERGQEDFASYAEQASAAGLTVAGLVVLPPTTWLADCPNDSSPQREITEWEDYRGRVEIYDRLAGYIGTWKGEHEAWIAEHLAPLTVRVEDFAGLAGLLEGLSVGNEDIVATAFEFAEERVDRDLSDYREQAQTMQADADRFMDQLDSGHPGVRAAAEAANPREMRLGLAALNEAIGDVARYGRIVPVVGGVIDVVSAGVEIANGGSVGSVGSGLLAGAGGAGLAGWALAGTAIPPLGVALIVGGVAVAAGSAGTWLWESAVPLDARESIDDFFTGSAPVLYQEWTPRR